MRTFVTALVVGTVFVMTAGVVSAKEGKMIENGRNVSFDYTLTVDGQVVDSSQGRKPLSYTHGEGKIVLGLSKQLEGLNEGDEKKIIVAPEDAYGVVDKNAFKEIPKSNLPQNIDVQIGTQLQTSSPDGQIFVVTVLEVKADTLVLDFNHPLAGKTLEFQIKILSVQ